MTDWILHHGDSLLWLPQLAEGSVDLLLTDPPYSSGGLYRGDRASSSTVGKYVRGETQAKRQFPEFHGDARDQRSMLAWCSLWLGHCWRLLRPGAVAAVFVDWRQLPLLSDALQVAGFTWRGVIAWDKTSAARTSAPGYPRHQCEFVLWGSRGALDRRPPGTGLAIDGCLRYPTDREREHPTGKPLGLLLDLVKLGRPGGRVLDPFAGSGSTGVAALRSGCSFWGAELSSDYHAIARASLEREGAVAADRGAQLGLGGLA